MNFKKQMVARMERSAMRGVAPGLHTPSLACVLRARWCKIAPGDFVRSVPSGLQKQRGISLIIVIFLLAAVSVMGLSMMNLSATQHMSSLYTARGTQAYFAARSGLEYAVAQVVGGSGCALPGPGTMAGFDIAIDCDATGPFNEGGTAYTIYRLTVTAGSGNFQAPDVANRQVMATVRVP